MKKYLLSIILIVAGTFAFTAQATVVTTIQNFSQGDIFTANAGVGPGTNVGLSLIPKPPSTVTVDPILAGTNTSGNFIHEYLFSPITNLVIAISSGSTNTGVGGIAGLFMTVSEVLGGSSSVLVPIGGAETLPLTMLSGKSYVIQMDNTGATANVSGGYLLAVSNVPVPAAVWLFGTAVFGLYGVQRRKAKGLVAA